ncbi:Hypothetical predicted protein [Marmota monax]|uniref:Uncharacterized protein n=1 Tax=Marmota monax TaxID=9995 RepID=A0A5E4ACC4_MARMO|nr:hypothetical protein GHT09_003848 [Marmota monax]VTJ54858.1 Hypothetical predicted protein [Marmota monax]
MARRKCTGSRRKCTGFRRTSAEAQSVLPGRSPAPWAKTPNHLTGSGTRGPRFFCDHITVATTPVIPEPLNSRCGPGALSLSAAKQPDTAPSRPELPPGIPDCLPWGGLLDSAPAHVPPRYRFLSEAGQHRDLPAVATARQWAGRGARGAGPESWPRPARRQLAIGSAPCAEPQVRGAASRPPSHRAPTLAGVTVSPPKERWKTLEDQVESRTVALQSGDSGHNYFCPFLSPARIRGLSVGASEGKDSWSRE